MSKKRMIGLPIFERTLILLFFRSTKNADFSASSIYLYAGKPKNVRGRKKPLRIFGGN